jgi:hypothetical protein
LNAKAGAVYYLRYSEVDKDAAKFADMTFHKNPLQVVTPDVALTEIQQTNMLDEGRGLISSIPIVAEKVKVASSATSDKDGNDASDSAENEPSEGAKSWSPF